MSRGFRFLSGALGALAALALCLVQPPPAHAADYAFKAALGVGEEYTDNVFETFRDQRTDFLTHLQPSLLLKYRAPLWDWDLGYDLDYRYYAKGSRDADAAHTANLSGTVKVVDERLFLDLSDTYKRVSLDTSRDTTLESQTQNQSDQNLGSVSPYLLLHPTQTILVKTGYRYVNTWYRSSLGVSKQDHIGFVDGSWEFMPRLFATLGYTATREELDFGHTLDQTVLTGWKYEHARESLVSLQAGYSWFSSPFKDTRHPFWTVALDHSFGRTRVSLATERKYGEDPRGARNMNTRYSGGVTASFERGQLGLSQSTTRLLDLSTDTVQSDSYTTNLNASYELLQRLTGSFNFTFDHIEIYFAKGYTRRYLATGQLSYLLTDTLTLSGTYRYVRVMSPVIPSDNKTVNHVILEVKKSFL